MDGLIAVADRLIAEGAEMAVNVEPGVPQGTVELGIWKSNRYRYEGGKLLVRASDNNTSWRRSAQDRLSRTGGRGFWEWHDARIAELTAPPAVQAAEVKDEDVNLAINYTTLQHALDSIRHILKEKQPSLDEIKQIADEALEDSEE